MDINSISEQVLALNTSVINLDEFDIQELYMQLDEVKSMIDNKMFEISENAYNKYEYHIL